METYWTGVRLPSPPPYSNYGGEHGFDSMLEIIETAPRRMMARLSIIQTTNANDYDVAIAA